MIVDDYAVFRAFVADALGRAGFSPQEAATGRLRSAPRRRRAPRRARRPAARPVRLRGVPGLRDEHGKELPIVFVSGERPESFDRVAGLLVGGDDYIAKPFALDELLARARHLIDRQPAAADNGFGLTARERQVLLLLAEGQTPAQIASELVISSSTVVTHI